MSDTFGLTLKRPLAQYDQVLSFWKMYEATLDLDLEMCLPTLPVSGMTCDGVLYELAMSERPIGESDYLSLPTPKTAAMDSCPAEYRRRTPSLGAVLNILPTPTASDKNDRQKSKNWKGDDLVSHVKTLNIPTPTASDSHWENTEAQRAGILGNHNLSLVEWARLSTRKMYRLHWIKVN